MFDLRINLPEFLDNPDMAENFAIRSYRFMAVVNKFFGGTEIVKRFIKTEIQTRNCAGSEASVKILDIGSGACDIPAAISHWAAKVNLKAEFTCIETNPYAIKLAKENIKNLSNIKLVQENIFNYRPAEKYDCATGSLFFHHLTDAQIIELICKLRTFGIRSILINDLHRSLRCYLGCLFASLFIGSDVRHDALLSIRRAFKPSELKELLRRIPKAAITVQTEWFARVLAVIRFTEEDR